MSTEFELTADDLNKNFSMPIHDQHSYFRIKSRCRSKKPVIYGKDKLTFKEEFKRIMAKQNEDKKHDGC